MKIKNELTLLIEQVFKLDIFGAKIHIIIEDRKYSEKSSAKKIQKILSNLKIDKKRYRKENVFIFITSLLK